MSIISVACARIPIVGYTSSASGFFVIDGKEDAVKRLREISEYMRQLEAEAFHILFDAGETVAEGTAAKIDAAPISVAEEVLVKIGRK